MDSLERRVVSKISWRLLPYLFLLYIIAYIDRINVGVAQLKMAKDLSLNPEVFGFGAGIFFVGYFLFEVPSNIVLTRVGARIWIARIMIFWGVISVAMMFARGMWSFYFLRFLLGAAEAGFFPGILFYLTRWFRAKDRARAISLFMTAGTLAGAFGNPLSGLLLKLDGVAHLKGWQWLFLIEGTPAVILGVSVLWLLTESPESARWLTAEEYAWLNGELERERNAQGPGRSVRLVEGLSNPQVWHLTLVYFLLVVGAYGFEFWIPRIVKTIIGQSDLKTTLVSAIPYLAATVGMVIIGIHSDRTRERRWHVAGTMFAAAAGFAAATRFQSPVLVLTALTTAWVGLKSAQGPFWAIPPTFLSGTGAAGGIALINSVANLGGQLGPWIMGRLYEKTGDFSAGLTVSSGFLLLAGTAAVTLRRRREATSPAAPGASTPG